MIDYLSLSITLFSLAIGSAIAIRFKVPSVIIFLLIGALIGTYNLAGPNSQLIGYLGQLGSILLLFVIGAEFSVGDMVKTGIRTPIVIAVIETLVSFAILFLIFAIKLPAIPAMLLALAFSITSTGVTLKLFQALDLKKLNISLILKINIIEDLMAVFIYSAISSFSVMKAYQPVTGLVISLVSSLVLFIVAYYVFAFASDFIINRYRIHEEDLLSIVLGVLLLFVYFATSLGLSAAFGAYIAGSIINRWKKKFAGLEEDLRKFSYIFISFFFLTVGLQVNLDTVDFALVLLVLPVIMAVKFLSVYLGTFAATRQYKTSLFTSLGMLSKGELSLVIISSAVSSSLLPSSFLGFAAFTVFFSALISYIALIRGERLYNTLLYKISGIGRFRA